MTRMMAYLVGLLGLFHAAAMGAEGQAPALRRGINLSHWFAQALGGDYGPARLRSYFAAEDARLIRSLGFDHVRFTIEPMILIDESDPGAGSLDGEYLKLLDDALDMLLAAELDVIVDMHPADEFKVSMRQDPRKVDEFAAFWEAMAAHLAGRDPQRVLLEMMNEPMKDDAPWWPAAQVKLLAAIRRAAPDHTVILTPADWSNIDALTQMVPLPAANVIYTFHMYEPFAFTHQSATWAGEALRQIHDLPYPASPEAVKRALDGTSHAGARNQIKAYGEARWDAAKVEQRIAAVAAWAKQHGVRVYCGEFGTYRKAPAADRARLIHEVRVALEKHGIGWAMWDYAGGFSVVTGEPGDRRPDEATVQALGLRLPKEADSRRSDGVE